MKINVTGVSFGSDDAGFQARNLQLRLATDRGAVDVTYDRIEPTCAVATVLKGLVVTTRVEAAGAGAFVLTHELTNSSATPLFIRSAGTGQFSADSGVTCKGTNGLGWDLRYAHSDNVRTERYPHCQMEYPYLRMLPTAEVLLGGGEDQAFPALYLHDQRSGAGLVVAAAGQDLNYTTFTIRKNAFVAAGIFAAFQVHHDFAQAHGVQLDPGQSVTLDGLYVQLTANADLNRVFHAYQQHLATRFTFRGPTSTLLTQAMHCTWNYGVFADQRQQPLLETARFIAANLPGIRYFLMDAGYLYGDIATTFLDRFYPDPNARVTPDKFPRGIRGFSDEVRRLGLRPGIWWSPTAQVDTELYRDHPDWFLRRADGGVYLIGEKNGFLDYSHPGALEHLDRTLAVILGQWGMDACKIDFWSQNFEDRDVRLHDPRRTAVQARTRFFDVVRKHLPPDGPFMTCVAVGMGNPFVGRWADTYRNTIDIGHGTWRDQVFNCAWSLPTITLSGRSTFLLNNDSVGVDLSSPQNENFFRLSWSFMHQGMIETGGRMEQWPAQYVDAMRRCTSHIDRGHPVRCLDSQAFTGVPLPRVLVVEYPRGSLTAERGVRAHLGLFNWEDQPAVVGVSSAQLGFTPAEARDFWTDAAVRFPAEGVSMVLPARSARLYEVKA